MDCVYISAYDFCQSNNECKNTFNALEQTNKNNMSRFGARSMFWYKFPFPRDNYTMISVLWLNRINTKTGSFIYYCMD